MEDKELLELAISKAKEEIARHVKIQEKQKKHPEKKAKLQQKYTIKNFVFEVMEAGFTKEYLKTHKMTTQRAKREEDVKTPMEERDVEMIISE